MGEDAFLKQENEKQIETPAVLRVETPRPTLVKYVFDHVEVAFDTSGKNYTELPEIGFSTYGGEPQGNPLRQPHTRREGVDMSYIARCVQTAMDAAGYSKVWFYPYDDDMRETAMEALLLKYPDMTEEEIKKERADARARLFQRYGGMHITPEQNGFGYILEK